MSHEDQIKQVKDKATKIFADTISDGIQLNKKIVILDPIPVLDFNREIQAWMIGIQAKDSICGYIQLNEALEFIRYASFQRKLDSLEGCPLSRDWTDPQNIRNKARLFVDDSDKLGEPYLSFHQNISRISWIVPAENDERGKYNVFVAGDYIFVG